MFEDIEDFVRKRMANDASHDFEHVLRVVRMCEFIGTREGANLSILIPAAFFHDIARPLEIEDPSIDHAKESARIAREYLSNRGYPYIDEIVYAIEVHRFRNNVIPVSKILKIVEREGYEPVPFAVAWVLKNPDITSPIIGPRTIEQLETYLKVLELDIPDEIMKEIDETVPPGTSL